MNVRPVAIAGAIALGIMLVLAAWAWVQLPPGAQVPIHWGVDGRPNGYASKEVALLLTPLLTVGLVALLYVLPRFEPRARNLAEKARQIYKEQGHSFDEERKEVDSWLATLNANSPNF